MKGIRTEADLPPASEAATATVTTLSDLCRTPFRIVRPEAVAAPVVFASPHSGRRYPDGFIAASALSPRDLRRSEDAYADILFGDAARYAPMLTAHFPRALIDPNRSPGEIDPDLFEDMPECENERSAHVAAGFGLIPRIVSEGMNIYRHRLSPYELWERLARLYHPYHQALAALTEDCRARFGRAIVIDCHTMPGGYNDRNIVLGDRFGTSVPERIVRRAEIAFAAQGFSVIRNYPYAGGYTTASYTRPQDCVYALQIEVNRELYLNADTLEPGPDFDAVRKRIAAAIRAFVVSRDVASCPPARQAAE